MKRKPASRGTALVEILVALCILSLVMIPISFSFIGEQREFGVYYHRALAIEAVDGEMEILRAGEWRAFPEGAQPYAVRNPSVTNLPPGRFTLTRHGRHLRLQWRPDGKDKGGLVTRETDAP
jgi:Tfp pilus assembly protein PilX